MSQNDPAHAEESDPVDGRQTALGLRGTQYLLAVGIGTETQNQSANNTCNDETRVCKAIIKTAK